MIMLAAVVSGQLVGTSSAHANSSLYDWSAVEKAMGTHGDVSANGAIVFGIPRTGLNVTLNGIPLSHGSDLTHNFDFMMAGDRAIMVGELVIKEDEVTDVTKKVMRAGIEETALHNHLLHESPGLMYLHVHGSGDPVEMAKAVRDITSSLGGAPGTADEKIPASDIDTGKLDTAIGRTGKWGGGVYEFSIPRADQIKEHGIELLPEMDISTEITFQPTGGQNALAIGELVLESGEVGPVLRALSDSGFEVTALHSHMLTEEPRLFYVHCWATGNAEDLAHGIRRALGKTNSIV